MSEKVLVSVFDKVAKLYSPVMTEVNQESAIRNFKIGAKQNAQISASPEDFELHLVGFWDDETGKVVGYLGDQPVLLFKAKDLFPAE
nr:MAG TPA: DNA binding protein [Microviridae sp.]